MNFYSSFIIKKTGDITEEEIIISRIFIKTTIVFLTLFVLYKLFLFFEMVYIQYIKKQLFFNHLYIRKRKLTDAQHAILNQSVKFYQRLSSKHQSNFEHRVFKIIDDIEFVGKDIEVTDEMKVITASTLVKLTFGLRDYNIKSIERIIYYEDEFYSQTNKAYHKGEFNLGLKSLVLSWNDVVYGYEIEDDNLNLAIHEFTHAIHFYYMTVRNSSASAAIFLNAFAELTEMLDEDAILKDKLVQTNFLRDYAFTNQFEFLSVVIETFIESPIQFKADFPRIYIKVKTMLGFNFIGY